MEPLRQTYVENTRNALLDAGRGLFFRRDYADIPVEDIVKAAGLTRGALYHHFQGKQGLFEAIFCEVEDELARHITAAMSDSGNAQQRMLEGAGAYLERCADDEFRHFALQQSVIALGWPRCVEIDTRYVGGIVIDAVRDAVDSGQLKPHQPELIATSFYGMLTNMALFIAGADNPREAQQEAMLYFADLVDGLRPAG